MSPVRAPVLALCLFSVGLALVGCGAGGAVAAKPGPGVIRGRVRLEGGGSARGIQVTAMPEDLSPGDYRSVTTECDARGRYELRGLESGRIGLVVDGGSRGYLVSDDVTVDLRRKDRATAPEIALRLGPEIVVTAREARSGAPYPGLRVKMDVLSSQKTVAVTDRRGQARFRHGELSGSGIVEGAGAREIPGAPATFEFSLKRSKLQRFEVRLERIARRVPARD